MGTNFASPDNYVLNILSNHDTLTLCIKSFPTMIPLFENAGLYHVSKFPETRRGKNGNIEIKCFRGVPESTAAMNCPPNPISFNEHHFQTLPIVFTGNYNKPHMGAFQKTSTIELKHL